MPRRGSGAADRILRVASVVMGCLVLLHIAGIRPLRLSGPAAAKPAATAPLSNASPNQSPPRTHRVPIDSPKPPPYPVAADDADDVEMTLAEALRASAKSEFAGVPWHVAELLPTKAEGYWARRVAIEYGTFVDSVAARQEAGDAAPSAAEVQAAIAFLQFIADDPRPLPAWRPGTAALVDGAACSIPDRFAIHGPRLGSAVVGASPRRTPLDVSTAVNVPGLRSALPPKHRRWFSSTSALESPSANVSAGARTYRSLSLRLGASRLMRVPSIGVGTTGHPATAAAASANRDCPVGSIPRAVPRSAQQPTLMRDIGLVIEAMGHGTIPVVASYTTNPAPGASRDTAQAALGDVPRTGAAAALPHEVLHAIATVFAAGEPEQVEGCALPGPTRAAADAVQRNLARGSVTRNATMLSTIATKLRIYTAQSLSAQRAALHTITAVPAAQSVAPSRVLSIRVGGSATRIPTAADFVDREAAVVSLERGLVDAGIDVVTVDADLRDSPDTRVLAPRPLQEASLDKAATEADAFAAADEKRWALDQLKARKQPAGLAGQRRKAKAKRRPQDLLRDSPLALARCQMLSAQLSSAWAYTDDNTSTCQIYPSGALVLAAANACAPSGTGKRDATPRLGRTMPIVRTGSPRDARVGEGDAGALRAGQADGVAAGYSSASSVVVNDVPEAIAAGTFDIVVYNLPDLAALGAPAGPHIERDRERHGAHARLEDITARLPFFDVVQRRMLPASHVLFLLGGPFELASGVACVPFGGTVPASSAWNGGRGLLRRAARSHGGIGSLEVVSGDNDMGIVAALAEHGVVMRRDGLSCQDRLRVQ